MGRRILVLTYRPRNDDGRRAGPPVLRVLRRSSRAHRIVVVNAAFGAPVWLRRTAFDVVVLDASLLEFCRHPRFHLLKWELRWLADMASVKIAIPRDEHSHSELLDEWMYELGVGVVLTSAREPDRTILYPLMSSHAAFYHCLPVYIDEDEAAWCRDRMPPSASRPFDLLALAYVFPDSSGREGHRLRQACDAVVNAAAAHGYRFRHATETMPGRTRREWLAFLGSGRAIVGCEEVRVLDRRGEIQAVISRLSATNPALTFGELDAALPPGWQRHHFGVLGQLHLDAVITRTCQVLIEGEYDGLLQPHRHYLPVKPDLSNLEQVVEQIRDFRLLQAVAERAFEDLCGTGRCVSTRLAECLDAAMDEVQPDGGRLGAGMNLGLIGVGGVGAAVRVTEWSSRVLSMLACLTARFWSAAMRLCHPILMAQKARLALGIILGDPSCRALLRTFSSHPAICRTVGIQIFLRDLLMLAVLGLVRNGSVPGVGPVTMGMRYSREQQLLVVLSLSPPSNPSPDARESDGIPCKQDGRPTIRRFIWDHSRVGRAVYYPLNGRRRVNLFRGGNGVYEFLSVTRGAEGIADEVWRMLVSTDGQVLSLAERPQVERVRTIQ